MTTNDKPLDEIPTATCEPSEICDLERFEIQTGDIKTPLNSACTGRSFYFNASDLWSNKFSFQSQNSGYFTAAMFVPL